MAKRTRIQTGLFLLFLASISGCIDPFNPPEINSERQYLVFDGFVHTNNQDTSWIKLSGTQNIHDTSPITYESGATITVEGDKGASYLFNPGPAQPGTYYLPPTYFDQTQNYRVTIRLRDRSYQSEWQPFQATPKIDSITYEVKGTDGVQVYVHTHDPDDKTRFYKWTFDETWEYFTPLYSAYEVVEGKIEERINPINRCWSSQVSPHINLFTTAALSKDIVKYHPVQYIPASSNKLIWGYSIIVHQQALSREGYDYWSELAQNTETNGSIFDPFPSQLTGNIHSLDDPDDKVFGFFSGGLIQSERIFIREALGRFTPCSKIDTLSAAEALESPNLIAYELDPPGSFITASPDCLDCRQMGGTLQMPWFWR